MSEEQQGVESGPGGEVMQELADLIGPSEANRIAAFLGIDRSSNGGTSARIAESDSRNQIRDVARYAQAALDREAQAVVEAPSGTRNERLNAASYTLALYVQEGWLDRDEVERRLVEASQLNGLIKDDGRDAVDRTIQSGLNAGLKQSLAVEVGPQRHSKSRGPLRIYRLNELEAVPPREWVVQGLIGKGDFSLICGQPGSGKSTLTSSLAMAVATGQEWFGRKTKLGAVLIIAVERGDSIHRKLAAEKYARGIENAPIGLMTERLDLRTSKTDDVDLVLEAVMQFAADPQIQAVGGIALIIIDTLHRAFGGGQENDSGEMGSFISSVEQLGDATGAHVMVVHHLPKDGSSQPRGHSSLHGAIDSQINVKATSSTRIAEVVKLPDGGDHAIFNFEIISQSIPMAGFEETSVGIAREAGSPDSGRDLAKAWNEVRLNGIAKRMFQEITAMIDEELDDDGHIRRDALYERCIRSRVTKGKKIESQRRSLKRSEDKLVEANLIRRNEEGFIVLRSSDEHDNLT